MGDCLHHWLIPSDTNVPLGVCKKCGAEKHFDNRPPSVWATFHGRPPRKPDQLPPWAVPFAPVNNTTDWGDGR